MSSSLQPVDCAHKAPPSVGFSRQEYWSGLPFPSPGDLPDPGIEPRSPTLQADALTSVPNASREAKELELSYIEGTYNGTATVKMVKYFLRKFNRIII